MSEAMKSSYFKIILFSMMAFSLMLFQNCGEPMPQDGSQDSSSVNAADGSYTEDFPFETTVDQIAMMSCSNNNPAEMGYFSFRAGAYHDQGIKLSDSFSSKYLMRSTDQLASLIYSNPLTNEIAPRFSLVSKSTSQVWLNDYLKNKNKMSLIGAPLTMFPIFKPLRDLKTGKRLNYLNQYEGTGKRNVQADILYSGAENNNLIQALVTQKASERTFAITYGPYSKPEQVLSSKGYQPAAITEAFGTTFDVEFQRPKPGSNSSNYVLSSIKEGATAWSCNENFRFEIYRMEDTPYAPCRPMPDLTSSNVGKISTSEYTIPNNVQKGIVSTVVTEEHLKLQMALRRILDPKFENWYIDVVNRCVVPKRKDNKDACYEKVPSSQNPQEMRYEILYNQAACSKSLQDSDGKSITDYRQCSHYVSLCNRFNLMDVEL